MLCSFRSVFQFHPKSLQSRGCHSPKSHTPKSQPSQLGCVCELSSMQVRVGQFQLVSWLSPRYFQLESSCWISALDPAAELLASPFYLVCRLNLWPHRRNSVCRTPYWFSSISLGFRSCRVQGLFGLTSRIDPYHWAPWLTRIRPRDCHKKEQGQIVT